MAHFRKRGKKGEETWTYIIDLGNDPLTKRRKQISKGGFKTKTEARSASRIVESEIESGTFIKESSMSFGDFATEWLTTYSHGVKISSVRAREKESQHFIKAWGTYPINQITKKMYQNHLYELSSKYRHNYVSGINTCGKMIFKQALELGLIKLNPTEGFRLPKPQQSVEELENEEDVIVFFEKDELAKFLKLAKTDGLEMDYLIFTILAYTGLRIGELLALKWTDINEQQKTLRVTKTLYNPNNNIKGYELLTPKTKKSKRTIRIDEFLLSLLKKHRIKQNEIKLKNRDTYQDNGFIFSREDGNPQLRKVVEVRLHRLLKKAGLAKKITPHSFRHTHASLLFEAGASIKDVMERLGHSDIETTMNIYTHVTKSMEEKASNQFSNLMKNVLK